MSCDELKELYELYALGAVDPAERREVEEHLERNCPTCGAGIKQAQRLVASLALAAPQVEPPKRLRHRVVGSVAPESQRPTALSWSNHAWATLALVMLAAVLWYVYEGRKLEAEVAALNHRMAEAKTLHAELVARNQLLTDALSLINLPDARQLVFGRPEGQPPRGRVWVHPQRGVVLLASNLRPAPAGKIYEMWVVPKKAPPIPAGLFNSDPQGIATHVWTQPVDVAAAGAIAVTLEPEGGAPTPTSTPLIVAGL